MNRRNAIRALMLGAPAAALGMLAGPSLAHGGAYTGEAGAELIVHGLGHTATLNNGPMRGVYPDAELSAVAREVMAQMRRGLPEIIAAYNRHPMKRA